MADEESKGGGVAAGGVGGNASEQEERLNWYRFTRILLDVIYPLLRRVFKDRFKQKYGIAWEDEKAESKILGTQTVGANPCGLFVHGGVIGDYDKSLPGEFELKEGGDELRTTEDLTALLEDGMFIRVGPDFAFTVRKSTARTPSVQPPKDHGAHGRSPGKVMLTRKHDGPAYKGKTATYASVFVPPLAKRNGSAVDNHIRRWIEAGASDKFEMTALNNILIGTAGCVMDPANADDPLFGNDVDDAEFWARVAGTSAASIPITGERIVQRLVIMRNGMMAHAAAARMPRLPDFDFVQRLSELAVNHFLLKGHTADDLAGEVKVILGENPGEDEFKRRTEAFMGEVQAWQEWCKVDALAREAAADERAESIMREIVRRDDEKRQLELIDAQGDKRKAMLAWEIAAQKEAVLQAPVPVPQTGKKPVLESGRQKAEHSADLADTSGDPVTKEQCTQAIEAARNAKNDREATRLVKLRSRLPLAKTHAVVTGIDGDGKSRQGTYRAPGKPRGITPNSVYLKGVDTKCTEDEISAALSKFGSIASVEKHPGRDYAFVAFADPSGAAAAVAGSGSGFDMGGNGVAILEHITDATAGGSILHKQFKAGDKVEAKFTATSRTWKPATVMTSNGTGMLELQFEGYHDIPTLGSCKEFLGCGGFGLQCTGSGSPGACKDGNACIKALLEVIGSWDTSRVNAETDDDDMYHFSKFCDEMGIDRALSKIGPRKASQLLTVETTSEEEKLLLLIRESPQGAISCSQIPEQYERRFGQPLKYKDVQGRGKLSEFLRSMPRITYDASRGSGYEIVRETFLEEEKLLLLIRESPQGAISCAHIPTQYKRRFGQPLKYKDAQGRGKLSKFLRSMPRITYDASRGPGYEIVRENIRGGGSSGQGGGNEMRDANNNIDADETNAAAGGAYMRVAVAEGGAAEGGAGDPAGDPAASGDSEGGGNDIVGINNELAKSKERAMPTFPSARMSAEIRKEVMECQKDAESSGVTAVVVGDDMTRLRGTIRGPIDSPYTGGAFDVDIQIPASYPFKPPQMKFDTKVWHPNVSSQTGAICLDILKDAWSPRLTIKAALVSLQALLSAPEPDDPQDAEVATMYKADNAAWAAKAQQWTEQFAKPGAGKAIFVKKFTDMGFPEDKVTHAAEASNFDEDS
eukprot:g779.t1